MTKLKTSVKYVPAPGGRLGKKAVQVWGQFLDDLKRRYGFVTEERVIDEAKDPRCPVHKFFPWNLEYAARQHWLGLARTYIGSVYVVVKHGDKTSEVRGFFNVKNPGGLGDEKRVYVTMATAFDNPGTREEILYYARQELKHWRDRYATYREFAEIVGPIDRFLEKAVPRKRKAS